MGTRVVGSGVGAWLDFHRTGETFSLFDFKKGRAMGPQDVLWALRPERTSLIFRDPLTRFDNTEYTISPIYIFAAQFILIQQRVCVGT
jgi:hypothetical protein